MARVAAQAGDDGTNDLIVSDVIRRNELQVWFVAEHVVEVPLTHAEFALLVVLARHPGRVLSRDQLLDAALGRRAEPYDRSIDVLVGRLRRKIEPDPKVPRFIVTMVGEGYKFARSSATTIRRPRPRLTHPRRRSRVRHRRSVAKRPSCRAWRATRG